MSSYSEIKIQFGTNDFGYRPIGWRAQFVPGTERTIAITRPTDSTTGTPTERRNEWRLTHVPTGCACPYISAYTKKPLLAKAKRLYRILKKHGVHKATDRMVLKKVEADYLKAFRNG